MSVLSYIEPVTSALNAVRSVFRPRVPRAVTVETKPMQFGRALHEAIAAADSAVHNTLALRDLNSDGMLSLDESGMSSKAFARLDTNGDGALDRFELLKAYMDTGAREPALDGLTRGVE